MSSPALAALERWLVDNQFPFETTPTSDSTVEVRVFVYTPSVPPPTAEEDPALAPVVETPPWAGRCQRWWLVSSAASSDDCGIWAGETKSDWFTLRSQCKGITAKAYSNFAEARAAWYGSPGRTELPAIRKI